MSTDQGPSLSAIVFDFDGLLMDTETTALLSWEYEWRQWGLTLDRSGFFADHGGSVAEERSAQLAAAVGAEFDRELSHRRRTRYREELHTRLDLRPGIGDWIEQAGARGLRLAVASSSETTWVIGHLERVGLLDRFTVIAGGEEVSGHKPDPSVYQLALRRLGIDAADAIAVEDTPHGVTAAHRAGLPCIAIPNPYVDPDRVGHAELVLGSATELDCGTALERACGQNP
ncbi:HAD family hydrolase [Microlunatus soli]|nr:HAD-IA family hydrolase [Microlunatus soli]